MHTTDFQKIAALPMVQDAIRQQSEAAEAKALAARLATLDACQQTADALADLSRKAAELDAMQDELNRQREELARQQEAHTIALQQAGTRHRASIRELRCKHGGELALTIGRMLAGHAHALRREAEYQRSVRDRKEHWTGIVAEVPSSDAMRKADELEHRAEQIEHECNAILALEYARVSPQAMERDIFARVKALGFSLNTATEQAGWRVEGWDKAPKTKAA